MYKILFTLVLVLVCECLSQRIIQPTWRPTVRPPIIHPTWRPQPSLPNIEPIWTNQPRPSSPIFIRTVRDVSDDEPLWLYKGDNIDRAPATGNHPILPTIIDDIKIDPNRRYARSLDSPNAKRSSGSHTSSGRSHDSGPTHPGYNRRNARDLIPTFRFPEPYPRPSLPTLPGGSRKPFPIYVDTRIA